jgi:nucleotide-binding universal stress UspA family protein
MRIQKILVPIDFSDHSEKAVECAIDLAGRYEAEVHLLNAYPVYVGAVSPYGIVLPESFDKECREAALEKTRSWGEKVSTAGVKVETYVTASAPADAIPRYVEEHGIDLVVMGSRGLTGIKHLLLGSVAERTLRVCPCPVLTVKADES